jgi:UDP-N-acetylglucosamine 2-epimerase (non-hydrolysing)
MPEEINRIVADHLSQVLFAPSRDACQNLQAEGIPADQIHFVGNVMIDSLTHALPAAQRLDAPKQHGITPGGYVVVTLHRPSNVDDPATLRDLLDALCDLARERPVVFPVHPRTRSRIAVLGFHGNRRLRLLDPISYIEMLSLVASAGLVITDSGGLQEETTFLGIPCLTVRLNTERPVTCTLGTNRLVPPRGHDLLASARAAVAARPPTAPVVERWDGKAAERIAAVLCEGARFDSCDS